MKKILIAILVLFVVIAGCSVITTDDNKFSVTPAETSTTDTADDVSNDESVVSEQASVCYIGDTWTVDGEWSVTVTGVEVTDYRNQFSEKDPAAVYIVTYNYTNLGYEDNLDIMDGLYISLDDTIVDKNGVIGYSYPIILDSYPQETPIGATCTNAQAGIGVENEGTFQLLVTKYDSSGSKQKMTFIIDVD